MTGLKHLETGLQAPKCQAKLPSVSTSIGLRQRHSSKRAEASSLFATEALRSQWENSISSKASRFGSWSRMLSSYHSLLGRCFSSLLPGHLVSKLRTYEQTNGKTCARYPRLKHIVGWVYISLSTEKE